jgi:aminodeoxychorismate synthase component I
MLCSPDPDTFAQRATPGARFPVYLEIPLVLRTPLEIFASARPSSSPLLLESGKGGRYSYVAIDPTASWQSRGTKVIADGVEQEGDPFELLRDRFSAERVIPNPGLRNFTGGLVGYISYDMARMIENLPVRASDDLGLPDSCFLFIDSFFEIDHRDAVVRAVHSPMLDDRPLPEQYEAIVRRLEAMVALLDTDDRESASGAAHEPAGAIGSNVSREEFCSMVERAREHIIAGDIFQVNLSIRFAQRYAGDPFAIYRRLRAINPSPYMSYLELPGVTIASASPEQLLRVDGRVVETRPIAGTRPRGATEQEDVEHAEDLIGNEKERAEHLMLVDLERNDIGRVARYGTVEVTELMAIERYSHVIHIVSNVRGELADGHDMFDAIRACFPGGTITGAPKVRSMEIIEELEPPRRGIYTGSIGWLGYDGRAELNIAIRTVVVVDGHAYAQAGAGIVFDSVPDLEYRESLRKAAAGLEAIRGW